MSALDECLKTSRCFCCLDLRRGGIVLGILGIFFAILGLMTFAIWPGAYQKYAHQFNMSPESLLFSSLASLITSGCFLHGVLQNLPVFLLPEILLRFIGLCLYIFVGLFLFITLLVTNIIASGKILIIFVPLGVLYWHSTAVAYSLYKQMKGEDGDPNNTGGTYGPNAAPPPYPSVYTVPQYAGNDAIPPYSNANALPHDRASKA